MSLITSCPACGTMFRVVADQLKISDGWVRCGHCSEVFDATTQLADESTLAQPAVAPQPVVQAQPVAAPPVEAVPAPRHQDDAPDPEPEPAHAAPVLQAPPPAAAPLAATPIVAPATQDDGGNAGVDSELEPSALDAPFVFRRSDLVDADDASPSVSPPAPSDSRIDHDDDAPDSVAASEFEDVPFVRQARRKAFWRRPLVRGMLVGVSLVLAALLVLQLAWHDRDRLAAAQPALRPALEAMCSRLGCALGQPRQIEAIVIDSSGFNRLRGDGYRLSFNVRNTARTPVAAPALELTLTDAQDQPVLRRVLMPRELGQGEQAIAPASDWTGSVGIVVSPGSAGRVAGYRLLAFYP